MIQYNIIFKGVWRYILDFRFHGRNHVESFRRSIEAIETSSDSKVGVVHIADAGEFITIVFSSPPEETYIGSSITLYYNYNTPSNIP